MRRILGIIFSYTVLAFAACLITATVLGHLPTLLEGAKTSWILCRAFIFFFRILPATLAAAFVLAFAIDFGKDAQKALMRFSRVIMSNFKHVLIVAVCLVAIMTVTSEILSPMIARRKDYLERAPHLLSEYIKNGQEALAENNHTLAHRYGTQAIKIDPKSIQARELIDKSEAVLKAIKKAPKTPVETANQLLPYLEARGETVTSLIRKSKEAAAHNKWFDSHYYAQLAISSGSGMDSNLREAKRLASVAWNNLMGAPKLEKDRDQLLFEKKRRAYKALSEGDNVESYYQFMEIAAEDESWSSDPDVTQYLEIAKKRVQSQCFFIDETDRLQTFENYMDVYFTIKHDGGVTDVIYIRGITPVSDGGRMVQYLRGFNMTTFGKNGSFVRSVSVPYVKLLSVPVDNFDEETRENLGLKAEYKSVPYLMLDSIDRNMRGKRSGPVWEYAPYITKENQKNENSLVLSMRFEDFNTACDLYGDPDKMRLDALVKMSSAAQNLGYSGEVFNSMMIKRLTYPLIMLIVLVILASVAWNLRTRKDQVFKFVWIFALPFCTVIIDIFIQLILTVTGLCTFAFAACAGNSALLVAFVIYALVLVVVSLHFVFKKSA